MKHISKLIIFSAAAALMVAGCKGDGFSIPSSGILRITASCPDPSRLALKDSSDTIFPAWETGDSIFGFDDLGKKFTFRVESVSAEGVATLSDGGYVPGSARVIHAIHCPGKSAADIVNGTLEVDLTSQSGKLSDLPVILTATGYIKDGEAHLYFYKRSAIVSVKKVNLPGGGEAGTLTIGGVHTKGRLSVIGGSLQMTTADTFDPITVNGSTPAYVAVLGTANAPISVSATDSDGEPYAPAVPITPCDVKAGEYYFVSKEMTPAQVEIVETGVKYATIRQATLAAATSKLDTTTIRLLRDVSNAPKDTINNENGKWICIDLNDHAITASLNGTAVFRIQTHTIFKGGPKGLGSITNTYANVSSRAIYLYRNYMNLVIRGGSYSARSNTGVIYTRGIGTRLLFEDGTVTNNRAKGGSALYIYLSSSLQATVNGGTFICNNGGEGSAVYTTYVGSGNSVRINGGWFHNGTSTGEVIFSDGGTRTLVYGGHFNKKLPSGLLPSGRSCTAKSQTYQGLTYNYTVQ